MADIFLQLPGEGGGWQQFKQIGTHPISGEPVFAAVHALEPNSIGGGGGGVADSVTIADGTTSTQKLAVSAAGAASVDTVDRAARLLGHVTIDNASLAVTGTFWQATQPVSLASVPTHAVTEAALDAAIQAAASAVPANVVMAGIRNSAGNADRIQGVSDNAATLAVSGGGNSLRAAALGYTFDGTNWIRVAQPLTDTQLRASAVPVSGPLTDTQLRASAVSTDVTDRAARLLGHITVDNASLAVTGTFWQATQPVSLATNTPDVTDRAARLLGHVTVDNASLAVTQSGTWTVQPGNTANTTAWLVDVSDRAARLLGHVTVDNATLAVTQSGTWTVQQGTPPWTVKGDQARASATIPNPVVAGARAATYPTKPASVSSGQLVDLVADTEGVAYIRPRQVPTYVAIYRLALAAASSSLAFTFTANTDKQLATIYHAATATKRVTIRRIWIQILKTGAVAGEVQFELRQLSATTAPATGNPAITPAKRDSSQAAAEATTLALPTTAGSEVATNSPTASSILNLAASVGTASGTGILPQDPMWIKLYDEASADDEEIAPVMRAGVAEGWAVIGRSTAAVPLNFIVRIVFTEE